MVMLPAAVLLEISLCPRLFGFCFHEHYPVLEQVCGTIAGKPDRRKYQPRKKREIYHNGVRKETAAQNPWSIANTVTDTAARKCPVSLICDWRAALMLVHI